MSFKSIRKFCALFIIVSFIVPAIVVAQEKASAKEASGSETPEKRVHPRDAYPPDQRPEEDYLARFKAIDISQKLMQDNLDNIFMLRIITSNFPGNGWDTEYKAIYDEYKKAVSYYYRRQVIYAQLELEKNKKRINELFKKIVVVYYDQAQEMLDKCADKILDFSLDERNKYDSNRNKVQFNNMMRLWVAYGQIDDSDSSYQDGVYKSSIFHLRIAKAYAMTILEELDPDYSPDKFRVHKADNLNRILSEKSQSTKSDSTLGSGSTK